MGGEPPRKGPREVPSAPTPHATSLRAEEKTDVGPVPAKPSAQGEETTDEILEASSDKARCIANDRGQQRPAGEAAPAPFRQGADVVSGKSVVPVADDDIIGPADELVDIRHTEHDLDLPEMQPDAEDPGPPAPSPAPMAAPKKPRGQPAKAPNDTAPMPVPAEEPQYLVAGPQDATRLSPVPEPLPAARPGDATHAPRVHERLPDEASPRTDGPTRKVNSAEIARRRASGALPQAAGPELTTALKPIVEAPTTRRMGQGWLAQASAGVMRWALASRVRASWSRVPWTWRKPVALGGAATIGLLVALLAVLVASSSSRPSEDDLIAAYPFGLNGALGPNGEWAPAAMDVRFAFVGERTCGGASKDTCVQYRYQGEGNFSGYLLMRRVGRQWERYSSEGMPFEPTRR